MASLPPKFLFKALLLLGCALEVFTEGRLPELHNELEFKFDRHVETRRDTGCVSVIGKCADLARHLNLINTKFRATKPQRENAVLIIHHC